MISVGKAWQLVAILLTFVVVTAAALLWRPHAPSFDARWVAMPPNINLETYRAARTGFGAAGVLHVGNV